MSKFDNKWYDKGYEDGYSDAINNIEIGDIINQLEKFSDEELQEIVQAIKSL